MQRATSAFEEGGGMDSVPSAVRVENETWNWPSGLGAGAGAGALVLVGVLDLDAPPFFFFATK